MSDSSSGEGAGKLIIAGVGLLIGAIVGASVAYKNKKDADKAAADLYLADMTRMAEEAAKAAKAEQLAADQEAKVAVEQKIIDDAEAAANNASVADMDTPDAVDATLYDNMTPTQQAAMYGREQTRVIMQTAQNQYIHGLIAAQYEWESSKEKAFQQAEETEKAAGIGFEKASVNTYLSGLQAAAGYTDMEQQASEGIGEVSYANAMSGTKQNTRYRDIVQDQVNEKLSLTKTSIERGMEAETNQFTGQYNLAMGSAANLKNTYSEGGSQYNIFRHRLVGMKQSFDDTTVYQKQQWDNYNSILGKGLEDASSWLNVATGTMSGASTIMQFVGMFL